MRPPKRSEKYGGSESSARATAPASADTASNDATNTKRRSRGGEASCMVPARSYIGPAPHERESRNEDGPRDTCVPAGGVETRVTPGPGHGGSSARLAGDLPAEPEGRVSPRAPGPLADVAAR